MKSYINDQMIKKFQKSLPSIRIKLGLENLSAMPDNFGVGGNTFRAYVGYVLPPSSVYRNWAKKQTNSIQKKLPVNETSSEECFINWHEKLYRFLCRYWLKQQGDSLSLAHGYKLVDLYIKWLSRYEFEDKQFVINLNKYANCAIDSQVLIKINICYSSCLPIHNPSMGHVKNKNTYDYCQQLISNFCDEAMATRLEFDYWAWKKGS
ncbi:hypothetical protein [Alteromonas stellipolaris]|uniref:hypothetical protein n=1 Tax=Alteromonas stellipolaris TaxID=233316 RepID=UPI001D4E5370|nr:hypothetical protein [Alteromonas stellipolaris]MBZ2162458.1 hypothetical protein [Alteromonas stellipolaris]